ncbi:dTDP-4-dehydrorhamnose reductase [bacterium SCSIO 12844]|nr:dTDP-4-dehydrorhamnose reductase [bacterium SCSIO 12844]
MKLLILGKNGQVGSALVEKTREENVLFTAVSRSELDITDMIAVNEFFSQYHDFDFIINAIAYTQVDQAENDKITADAVNHLAIKKLAIISKQYEIPLIHISTDYVFDGKKATAYSETDQTNPLNQYGLSKLNGERILQQTWHQHIILRVSWVFSEYRSNFIKTMIRLAKEKDHINIVADQYGAPTSANSIAKVIFDICRLKFNGIGTNKWGIYHYTDFPVTTWHQLALYSIEQLNDQINDVKTKHVYPIASSQYPTLALRPKNSALDTDKIKTDFSIKQYSWMDEVARIVDRLSKEK